MTNRFSVPSNEQTTGIEKLFRAPRDVLLLQVVESGTGITRVAAFREKLLLMVVPVETRDLLSEELRQSPERSKTMVRVRFAGWELDLLERRLTAPGGGVARIPACEYTLLHIFVNHPRQLLTRAELALSMRHEGRSYLSVRSVNTYVSRLRRRLSQGDGGSLISTVQKRGYSFDVDVLRT